MTVQEEVQSLIDSLTALLPDAERHDKGQFAAGTRLRKGLSQSQKTARAIRDRVQADRETRAATTTPAA